MVNQTGNQISLRRRNLAGVLHEIYRAAPVSRTEVARQTGLNKATVTNLTGELLRHRLIREIGEGVSMRAGRRQVLLDIEPRHGCIIGVEIGVGFLSVVCADFKAAVIWRRRNQTKNFSPPAVLKKVAALIANAKEFGERAAGPLLGIAIGIPGLIDQQAGTLLFAPNLEWRNVAIAGYFSERFSVPILLENEANFAALGEKYFGVARKFENILYISAGIGIGGGVIIDGRVHNGSAGYAGEFGHITIDPKGTRCKCGNTGCWETQASQAALVKEMQGHLARSKGDEHASAKALSLPAIFDAARAGNKAAVNSFKTIGAQLGIGIDSLIKIFNPEIVVFGGGLSIASEFILPAVRAEIARRGMIEELNRVEIVIAKFGKDAAVMGGVAKVFQAILADPI